MGEGLCDEPFCDDGLMWITQQQHRVNNRVMETS